MTQRTEAPAGSPCWADLWTSDVAGSRRFYEGVFGWEAQEPSAEFGGYFMFFRDGVPVAGGMGDMGDMAADDSWKIYLNTADIDRTVASAADAGAQVVVPRGEVADLGVQGVLVDPTGAVLGAWQPGTFPGFTVLNEHGAPSWFELHTGDHAAAVGFYRSVFGWDTTTVSDTDEFRYSTMRDPGGGDDVAGVAEDHALGDRPAHWVLYWEVDDVDAALTRIGSLGGTVVSGPDDTPYGRLAKAADPAGAEFCLRTTPKG